MVVTAGLSADAADADADAAAARRVSGIAAAGLAAVGVLAQICYPLLAGDPLAMASALSVVAFAGAAGLHCAAAYGPTVAGRMVLAATGIGLTAEALGTGTGYPFGAYAYAADDRLGPHLLEVPLLVPLAWTMLAYPCLLAARGLSRPRAGRVALGAVALTGWDLFLDPQMVAAGHWAWQHPTPALPGVPGIPLTNYAGWLLVAAVMIAVLDRVLPDRPAATGQVVPACVLAWTWLGSTLGNLAFFDRPWVAVYGFAGLGLVAGPYLWQLVRPVEQVRQGPGQR